MPALDVAQERTKLEESLAELVGRGAVEIDWLEQATLQALQRQLRHDDYHVFHYIGHGGYDRGARGRRARARGRTGRSRLVSGMELGTILADETTLRLAVLNACEGARSSVDDPFSGVATSLVRREIPAVVAMQLEITDRAAITFAVRALRGARRRLRGRRGARRGAQGDLRRRERGRVGDAGAVHARAGRPHLRRRGARRGHEPVPEPSIDVIPPSLPTSRRWSTS